MYIGARDRYIYTGGFIADFRGREEKFGRGQRETILTFLGLWTKDFKWLRDVNDSSANVFRWVACSFLSLSLSIYILQYI